jgi:ribokinase
MPELPRVTVLGSLNTDISVAVPQLPGPGETVLGSAAVIGPGGKGANQAVAAARLGAAVRMAGCVGDDDFGRGLVAGLAAEGVDTSGVRPVGGVTSGLALISVDPAGENTIAVAPGANAQAGEQEVAAAFAAPCDVLVLSAEVPAATLAAALARARAAGVASVLNLAPAPAGARDLVASGVDWLVVNAPEAVAVLGRPVSAPAAVPSAAASVGGRAAASVAGRPPGGGDGTGPADAERGEEAQEGLAGIGRAAAALAACGARYAVITLGAAGAVLAPGDGGGRPVLVPGFTVAAVDSVGAGDAFVGALAVALASGAEPAAAVRAACAAGAAAVTRRGARGALPRPADVQAITGLTWPGSAAQDPGAQHPGAQHPGGLGQAARQAGARRS